MCCTCAHIPPYIMYTYCVPGVPAQRTGLPPRTVGARTQLESHLLNQHVLCWLSGMVKKKSSFNAYLQVHGQRLNMEYLNTCETSYY
jgi:hypothetical protein